MALARKLAGILYAMWRSGTPYNPAFSGEIRVPSQAVDPLPLDERKIVARRCATILRGVGLR